MLTMLCFALLSAQNGFALPHDTHLETRTVGSRITLTVGFHSNSDFHPFNSGLIWAITQNGRLKIKAAKLNDVFDLRETPPMVNRLYSINNKASWTIFGQTLIMEMSWEPTETQPTKD